MKESANVNGTLTSGTLGKAIGVSADTIRHYERIGLLAKPLRSGGGYRQYDPSAIVRVQTIQSAVKAGFSLAELVGIFKERDAGGAPCRRVAALAADKVEGLECQIRELTGLKEWLASTLNEWQRRLENTPVEMRAGLLESLGEKPPHDKSPSPKGIENESPRPHLRPLSGRKRYGTIDNGLSNAQATPKRR